MNIYYVIMYVHSFYDGIFNYKEILFQEEKFFYYGTDARIVEFFETKTFL